jgi:Tripartite tricarboxylate transporter family receptor
MLSRRHLLSGLAVVAGLRARPAAAQAYPARPITLIVPFAAGGFNDVIVRILAQHMSTTLGQSIIIENDAGAGGTPATARAARAPADGYTILAGSMGTHAAAPTQYPTSDTTRTKISGRSVSRRKPRRCSSRAKISRSTCSRVHSLRQRQPGQDQKAHAGVGSQMHTYCTLSWAPRPPASPIAAPPGDQRSGGGRGRLQLRFWQRRGGANPSRHHQGHRRCQPPTGRRHQGPTDHHRGGAARILRFRAGRRFSPRRRCRWISKPS